MKRLTTWFLIATATAAALALSACGKSGGGGGANNLVTGPIYPIGGVPPGSRYAFYSQNDKMQWYFPGSPAELSVSSGMRDLMKLAMGVCDRQNSSGGLANCSTWMNGFHDIVVLFDGNLSGQARVIIRSYPYQECTPWNCSSYYSSLPSFREFFSSLILGWPTYNTSPTFNPMIIQGPVSNWNSNQGFKIEALGPQGSLLSWNQGTSLPFEIEVETGKIEDFAFPFRLKFQGQLAATGVLRRCNTSNCGIQGL